jgi:hypothetical protein
MEINIFILCYNEAFLLPHTVKHYRKYLPSCKITIYDNESTDNSVELAKSLGCSVISWNSDNIIDDHKYLEIKNNCWKHITHGWIIMMDMDEFLCVTEDELLDEMKNETSILQVKGINMFGESNTLDLTDIDLQEIKKYNYNTFENKNLCFFREKIEEISYGIGAHDCFPVGNIKYSSKIYYNKHMNWLGLNYIIDKKLKRYERSELMRSYGWCIHYINDITKIKDEYNFYLNNSSVLSEI